MSRATPTPVSLDRIALPSRRGFHSSPEALAARRGVTGFAIRRGRPRPKDCPPKKGNSIEMNCQKTNDLEPAARPVEVAGDIPKSNAQEYAPLTQHLQAAILHRRFAVPPSLALTLASLAWPEAGRRVA